MRIINITGKIIAVVIYVMTGLANNSRAQDLSGIQSNFNAYQKAGLYEKLYVHTNKNFYITGEILWFKIYNTEGSTNKLLDLSKVAYVEILDNKHIPVLQAKIALNIGMGNGSFYLPFSLSNGNYQLRAYTNWMKNFDIGYFFEKQITIVNTIKASPDQSKAVTSAYDIQFFPEGGHLVKGLNSKIAFKVTAQDGKGYDCTGAIVNQQNDTLVRFRSLKFGIGSFTFTPSEATGYRAIIKIGAERMIKDLPEINESGYVMQATDHGENWDVAIQNSNTPKATNMYIIVHSRNEIKLAQRGSLVNGVTHFIVSKDKLGEGVNYITLFDDQQRPVCERLIFNRPAGKLVINANTDAQTYRTRTKVDLNIATRNQDNKEIQGNLSVAVFRLDSLQKDDATHIAGYLLLKADLKGHIESPDYYVDNINEESSQALDNLMLSQGWTQFDWSKILAGETHRFKFLPEYTGPIVTGTVTNALTNKPAENIFTYLTIPGPQSHLFVAKSDSAGKLLFSTKNFYGPREIILQNKWQQDSIYHINIANPFIEEYTKEVLPVFHLNTNNRSELVVNSLNMQVQNIFDAKQLKQFNEPVVDSSMFYGKPAYSYLLDDYVRFSNIEEVIHEYVRLVLITRDHGKRGFEIIHDKEKGTLPGQPLVILDNKPIFDLDRAYALDPLKIKRLDVVNSNYIYGPAVLNGIISFTTYNGISPNTELDPHAIVFDYEGLQLDRKFYSPVYDTDEQHNNTIPDFRSVLYWNPNISTGTKGNNRLSFYTSDKSDRYVGIVEGISAAGDAGTGRFYFEVKK